MTKTNKTNQRYTLEDYIKKQEKKDPTFKRRCAHEVKLAEIALTIAKARTKQGLTQTELAKKIHTTQQVISNIEHSKTPKNITLNTLVKITNALKIHVII